jgi:hypothetical protein
VVVPFDSDLTQNVNFLSNRLNREVNRSILQVGFQPFCEMLHHLLIN